MAEGGLQVHVLDNVILDGIKSRNVTAQPPFTILRCKPFSVSFHFTKREMQVYHISPFSEKHQPWNAVVHLAEVFENMLGLYLS